MVALLETVRHDYRDIGWWKTHFAKENWENRDLQFHIRGVVHHVSVGYWVQLFSNLEHTARGILRGLDPSSCNHARDAFESVYKALLRKLDSAPSGSMDLFKLARLIRNTIHNNGIHLHPKGRSDSVTWQGKRYEFRDGHPAPVGYLDFQFLGDFTEDTRRVLYQIAKDSKLVAIEQFLPDHPNAPKPN